MGEVVQFPHKKTRGLFCYEPGCGELAWVSIDVVDCQLSWIGKKHYCLAHAPHSEYLIGYSKGRVIEFSQLQDPNTFLPSDVEP